MAEESRVELPPYARERFEVYVNGVLQQEGRDFVRESDALVFRRSLAREGRLGPIRWLSLFLGIAGTYRQDDTVDIVYDVGGRRLVATGLPISPGGPGQGDSDAEAAELDPERDA